MLCRVYLKDGNMSVGFDGTSLVFGNMLFQIGDAVTDFTALHEEIYVPILKAFKESFLAMYYAGASYDDTLIAMSEKVIELSNINPYFNFYLDNFVIYLIAHHGFDQRGLIPLIADSFLLSGARDLKNTDAINPKHSVNNGLEVFVNDLQTRQMRLKEDFDIITGCMEDIKELSPMQRLYIISMQGRNYLSGIFQTSLMPDHFPMPDSIEKMKSTLLENKVDIVEMVDVETIDDLLGYELYHTLKLELPFRKCKYCNEYFIIRGRSDMEYCDRKRTSESKPCNIIGATRNYWDGKKDDPIHKEFQKAYKRNHSRRRVGTMSESDFFHWSEEARAKLKECESGQFALEEFRLWLGNKR
ncbi:MAG: DUF6076 domain-containing protein [Oscillospiraceae bacterium]|jgi:hypothetical protein|nr:DUF6076 domain-containing protein [Oscillospiraceae bacterium]